jgi:hypothetical protein
MVVIDEFLGLRGFPNSGCVNERFRKSGFDVGLAATVSHVTHREEEKGCAIWLVYVRSKNKSAWTKGLKETGDPQRGEI